MSEEDRGGEDIVAQYTSVDKKVALSFKGDAQKDKATKVEDTQPAATSVELPTTFYTSQDRKSALHFAENPLKSESSSEARTAKVVSTGDAVDALIQLPHYKDYSLEEAKKEHPLMHYTRAGNILQVLRFGIQSNNFKSRLNEYRSGHPQADSIGQEMCGLRIKQGGSYQGRDSISMSIYDETMFAGPGNILFLVNPEIKTFGEDKDREKTGYGHGISTQVVDGFELGNPTAYKTEVLAANVILPIDIRAIVVDNQVNILREMNRGLVENTKLYIQERTKNQNSSEDLLAGIRLLADLSNDHRLRDEAVLLQQKADSLTYNQLVPQLQILQRKGLEKFVGDDKELTEENLRKAMQEKFGIKFLM